MARPATGATDITPRRVTHYKAATSHKTGCGRWAMTPVYQSTSGRSGAAPQYAALTTTATVASVTCRRCLRHTACR